MGGQEDRLGASCAAFGWGQGPAGLAPTSLGYAKVGRLGSPVGANGPVLLLKRASRQSPSTDRCFRGMTAAL